MLAAGCASNTAVTPTPSPPQISPAPDPDYCKADLIISCEISDFKIINTKIIDFDSRIGQINFDGRYPRSLGYIYKFSSTNCHQTHWTGRIDTLKFGRISATMERKENPPPNVDPGNPPCNLEVGGTIKNGIVQMANIRNYQHKWQAFDSEYNRQQRIFTLQNITYPGCKWNAISPATDGNGIMKFKIEANTCTKSQICEKK